MATDVFATDGLDGTALKHVAELVGIREATLFHYFRGKQELLTAVLRERDTRSANLMSEGSLLRALPRMAETNAEQPGLTALFAVASAVASDPAHDSHAFFQERYAMLVEMLIEDIRDGQTQGRVRRDLEAETMARIVIAAFDGLQLQWLYDKSVNMADGLLDVITVLLTREGPQI
jgi:AcrR family transcriptional regulator